MSLELEVGKKVGNKLWSTIRPRIKNTILTLLDRKIGERKNNIELKILETHETSVNEGICLLGISSIGNTFDIKEEVMDSTFYIQIPPKFKDLLTYHKFYSNTGRSDNSIFKMLNKFISSNYKQINNAASFIENNIEIVSEQFISDLNSGKQRSNNIIYGVYSLEKADDSYSIRLFKTDYYTYNIICEIYKSLYKLDSSPLKVKRIEDINRIAPLVCCCSTGGFVDLDYKGVHSIIVGKRSDAVACPNTWHTSFDETFDPRDKIPDKIGGEHPSLTECIIRGLFEELKIEIKKFKFNIDKSMICVIQTENRLELGIYIILRLSVNTKKNLKRVLDGISFAPDIDNEYEKIILVPFESMSQFYKNKINTEKTTEEAPFLWENFALIDTQMDIYTKLLLRLYRRISGGYNDI